MRKFVLAALMAGGMAAPALAQPAADFSGLRVEGLVGYERSDVEGENSDGIAYGAGIGYDFQTGGMVIGVEGEVSDSTVDECVGGVALPGDRLCAEFGRDLYAGGRVGGLIGSNTLLYAKAGYTNGRVALDYEDGTSSTAFDFNRGENLDGLRVGGGLEFALGPNSYAKTEYRYTNYEQDFEKHQVVAGFGFRF